MPDAPNQLPVLAWDGPEIANSLTLLRRYVESEAQRQIDWYFRKMTAKSRASSALRFAAIVLFLAGGLAPLAKAALTPESLHRLSFDIAQAGYLLLALAAGCLALDRFFGFSTAWMRYVTAALALEKSLEEFRLEWTRSLAKLRGAPPNDAQLDQLILTCETFSLAIRSQVEQETNAWVAEFQSNLAQLEQELHARAAEFTARRIAAE